MATTANTMAATKLHFMHGHITTSSSTTLVAGYSGYVMAEKREITTRVPKAPLATLTHTLQTYMHT